MKRYLTEFIGTYFLITTCIFTQNIMAVGFILIGLIYMGKSISGAHYNPATTLTIYLKKMISFREASIYAIIQLSAAMFAALTFLLITGNTYTPTPYQGINIIKPFFIEVIGTFIIMYVILAVAANPKNEGNEYYGIAIGFTLIGSAYIAAAISGAVFNPAYGLGSILIDWAHTGLINYLNIILYTVGPFAGGVLALGAYKITHEE